MFVSAPVGPPAPDPVDRLPDRRAEGPNSWPSVIGTASCSWVRPILITRVEILGLRCEGLLSRRVPTGALEVKHGRGGRRWETRHWWTATVDVRVRIEKPCSRPCSYPRQFERAIGDDLVRVHVRRGAGAPLDRVDDELGVSFPAMSRRRPSRWRLQSSRRGGPVRFASAAAFFTWPIARMSAGGWGWGAP